MMADAVIRDMAYEDIQNGLLETLDALRPASHMDADTCRRIYDEMKRDPNRVVAVAVLEGRVVGTATLIMERKFIHDGGRAGHIEDVSVNRDFQGRGLGKMVVQYLLDEARRGGCYKTTLDCKEDLEVFYTGMGFLRNGLSMRVNH